MDLQEVLKRIAQGLEYVDAHTNIRRGPAKKPGSLYLPGLPSLYEEDIQQELKHWWESTFPNDFRPRSRIEIDVPFPNIPGAKCDMAFSTSRFEGQGPEWAIELKVIRFIGDNGGKNPFGTGKFLSPYKMETSLTTDIVRLHNSTIAPHKAVIGFAFNYSFRTCDEALRRHPLETQRIEKMRQVCRSNDASRGIIDVRDLLRLVDYSTGFHGVSTTVLTQPFIAWRNPTGGEGLVFGWSV